MPDDVERPTFLGDGSVELEPSDVDVLDELLVFVTYRPAWVNKDGFPLSWQHYNYGLRHIARENMREQLRIGQSIRMSRTPKEDFDAWQRDVTRLTEVPKYG